MIKLHLGCGENYLEGYVNVDLPPSEHSVMKPKADIYKDMRTLSYVAGSIAEIRAHHLLEHFSRQEALKLLLQWRGWLMPGGILHVETPDFEESARQFANADLDEKFAVARHLFGSQESPWAFHKDWWGEDKYRSVFPMLGFAITDIRKEAAYLGHSRIPKLASAINRLGIESLKDRTGDRLRNITVKAVKTLEDVDISKAVREILARSLVGAERGILEVWVKEALG